MAVKNRGRVYLLVKDHNRLICSLLLLFLCERGLIASLALVDPHSQVLYLGNIVCSIVYNVPFRPPTDIPTPFEGK